MEKVIVRIEEANGGLTMKSLGGNESLKNSSEILLLGLDGRLNKETF